MIKTTFGKLAALRDQSARPGPLTKIAESNLSFADGIRAGRWLRPLIESMQEFEKIYGALAAKHGDPISTNNNGAITFSIRPEELATFHEERLKLEAVEIEISAVPLPVSILEKMVLTPRDLILLEGFIDQP